MTEPQKISLKHQLKLLVALQELDSEIFELSGKKSAFPVKRNELDAILETKTSNLKAAEENLKKVQMQKNDRENDLRSAEDKIKKYESELSQIKTNKEYKAMLDQIASAKADVSLVEEKIIVLLDEIDKARSVHDVEKGKFEQEKKSSDAEKNVISSEEKVVDTRLAELAEKRALLLKHDFEPLVLKKYEQILLKWGRSAVAKLEGEFCGECNMLLRPQIVNNVKIMKELVLCESCSRILYSEEALK